MDLERESVGIGSGFERFDGFENRGLQRKPVVDKESRANPDEPIRGNAERNGKGLKIRGIWGNLRLGYGVRCQELPLLQDLLGVFN